MIYTKIDVERFLSKIQYPIDLVNDCWMFDASNANKYPRFWLNGKWISSHRFMYQYYFKININSNILICHSCDTPFCVSPYHLFLGTHDTNNKDRNNKNRQAKGEDFSFTKLTDDLVREIIIDVYNNKYQSVDQICNIYKVQRNTIVDIFNGKNWKHITSQLVVPLNQICIKIINPNQDGENNPSSKLTNLDIPIIRSRILNGDPLYQIAKTYNVDQKTIRNIKNNKSWKNI